MALKSTYNFDLKKKYVVACSFGPDSMALLNYLFEQKINVIAAHVNYHKRDVSNQEEIDLKSFCKDRNIPCEVLDTANLSYEGNFQEWARDIRYDFFADVVKKYGAEGVVVAHQEDDVIETYLMQKKRGNCTKNAGIAKIIDRKGLTIIRPFLTNSKADLLSYDKENNVPFSIDVSNLTNAYKRNQIRHSIVEKMSREDRVKILKEIENKNKQNEQAFLEAKKLGKHIEIGAFLKLSIPSIQNWLFYNLNEANFYRPISAKFVKEFKQDILCKNNVYFWLSNSFGVCRLNDTVKFFSISTPKEIVLNKGQRYNDEFIEIDFTSGAEDRNILESDYPLTIKVPSIKDKYKVANYSKEVRRLYIDWKMPQYIRKIWPGVYSHDGRLIYLPRYRENFEDNHKSVFKIKIK